jgi:hypothetical protein
LNEFVQGVNARDDVIPRPRVSAGPSRSRSPRGWRIDKEKQSHKIDVVVALAMAAYAAVQYHTKNDYNTNYEAWVGGDGDWQSFRTSMYITSGGRIII